MKLFQFWKSWRLILKNPWHLYPNLPQKGLTAISMQFETKATERLEQIFAELKCVTAETSDKKTFFARSAFAANQEIATLLHRCPNSWLMILLFVLVCSFHPLRVQLQLILIWHHRRQHVRVSNAHGSFLGAKRGVVFIINLKLLYFYSKFNLLFTCSLVWWLPIPYGETFRDVFQWLDSVTFWPLSVSSYSIFLLWLCTNVLDNSIDENFLLLKSVL